ncbi:MAG TPA: hypothetical protein VGO64_03720 [Candidatus Limnocylindrales bacterium]|jgi:hypothetical protein|nr:hypothetical protein [Candidatus Limnocylindrales bacterium]
MERRNGGGGDVAVTSPHGEALEFVRFCHRRKRVGWPELYDEMCAVAGRGLYRGYGSEELAEIGIGFGLFEMPSLAGIVGRVVAEDLESRRRTAEAVRAAATVVAATDTGEARGGTSPDEVTSVTASTAPAVGQDIPRPAVAATIAPDTSDSRLAGHGSIRLALPAGA